MKIVYVITGLGMGGAEKVVTNLADNMSKLGHTITLVYLVGEPIVVPESLDINIISLDFKNKPILSFLKFLKNLYKLNPDIVHSHMYHANILSRIARIFKKIPKLICTSHNSNEGSIFRMISYRFTNFLSDVNTNVSIEACNSLISKHAFSKDNIICVYNGIDHYKFKLNVSERARYREKFNLNKDEKIIISIGSMTKQKDYPNLLHAIKKMDKNIDFKVFIVGDGPEFKNVSKLIIDLKLTEKIILLGIRKDVPSLLSMSDIFVLSSAWEGFGLVVAEAMSNKKIVIATDCGGVREVLRDENFLVPPKDSQALAEKIKIALELKPCVSIDIGEVNYSIVSNNFTQEIMIRNWLAIYN